MEPAISSFWGRLTKKHPTIRCHPQGPISIDIQNLSVQYPNNPVISGLTCHFETPSLWAIAGPNGAGKSTLLKTLLGLQKFKGGKINFHGLCPCDVAYLTQQNQLDRRFPLTVGDTIAMGLFREVGIFRRYTKEQRDKMQDALEQVGLASFSRTPLQALSGGQFQRVLFARLILQDAPVIFLDEPFTGVDGRTIDDLMALLHRWVKEGRLVLAVLHDLDLTQEHFPNTLLLARHFYKAGLTEDVLTKENMRDAVAASRHWEAAEGTP
ncbi:MAG: metal ABC transporter ATP-binding protein [Proteobacteria bacterium]|nr:metal ABC transporter ATP-binding protein [Pseudomonadota bacterium]